MNVGRRAVIALGILLACRACASALDPSLEISQHAHTAWRTHDVAEDFHGVACRKQRAAEGDTIVPLINVVENRSRLS